MKHEIIGPCTPQEKNELRAILEGMGEKVEAPYWWNSEAALYVGFFEIAWESWIDPEPTISFQDFKDKYAS
jgi:hypothetical protein